MADPVAGVPEDDYVLAGNPWRSKAIELPATDAANGALTWGTFSATTEPAGLPIECAVDTTGAAPVVTLSLAAEAIPRDFEWYLAESSVFGGEAFLTGTVHKVAR